MPLRAGFGLLDEGIGGWGTGGGRGELGGEGLSVGGVRKKRGWERRKRRTVEKSKGISCGDRHWGSANGREERPRREGDTRGPTVQFLGGDKSGERGGREATLNTQVSG